MLFVDMNTWNHMESHGHEKATFCWLEHVAMFAAEDYGFKRCLYISLGPSKLRTCTTLPGTIDFQNWQTREFGNRRYQPTTFLAIILLNFICQTLYGG